MIREWLERNGWTCVRSDEEGELYTKGNPVAMNTAAALFSELMDREANYEARRMLLVASNEIVERYRERIWELEGVDR